MKSYTSKEVKDILSKLGIKSIDEKFNKRQIISLFTEKDENNKYKYSNSKLVSFMKELKLDYSDFLDCDRAGILRHFNKEISIKLENRFIGVYDDLFNKIRELFWQKPLNIFNELEFKQSNRDEIEELYNKLRNSECIENFEPSDPCQVSTDNKFYYLGESLVDITSSDNIWLQFGGNANTKLFILCEEENNALGAFVGYGSFVKKDSNKYYLELSHNKTFIDFKKANKAYKIVFSNESQTRWYAVSLEAVSEKLPEENDAVLCIDFGTSNTSAGTWDNNDQSIKLVEFDDITDPTNSKSSNLFPTVVYIKRADLEKVECEMLFGYEALNYLKKEDYQPKGSFFRNIKQWLSASPEYKVECKDEKNQAFKISADYIIAKYISNIINISEIKLKKHYVNLHFSAPIKLKARLNDLTSKFFNERGYKVLPASETLDEGVSIIYKAIADQRKKFKVSSKKEETGKIMIMDCGGGTTDIASCKYRLSKADTGIKADISTKFEKSFSFGGNDLTYLIFQLLKIKLSEYYRAGNSDKKIRISVDSLLNTSSDYLLDIDTCVKKNKKPELYSQLNEESSKAEWFLPTDFGNKDFVDGNNNINFAHRNFVYLWELADNLKIKFFSNNKMASMRLAEDVSIKADPSMYFYVDVNGEHVNSKQSLKKMAGVPDIEINIKELSALLSPQIYYTLSQFMPEQEKFGDTMIRLSGQSSKINLFTDLLKEFVNGKILRKNPESDKSANSIDKKLNCVKGCIQYLIDKKFGTQNTKLTIDMPNIPFIVNYVRGDNEKDELFNGSKIKTENGKFEMSKIPIIKRELTDGMVRFKVYNTSSTHIESEYTDTVKLKYDIGEAEKLDGLSTITKKIKNASLREIENFYCLGEEEKLLDRLVKGDLKNEKADSDGKLLIFAVPNNDGCGFILYQVALKENEGSKNYYLTAEDKLPYQKIEEFKSIFDGRNCKLPENNNKNE